MLPLLVALVCAGACRRGRHRSHGRNHALSGELGRPRVRRPRFSRYELFRRLGRELSPHDYGFLADTSATDRRIAAEAAQFMEPELERILRHHRVRGRERGDYDFDRHAADLVRSIRRQISIPSPSQAVIGGLIKGFSK